MEQLSLQNRLLSRLSPGDFALLSSHLEPVRCPRDQVLVEPQHDIPFAYFLHSGIASVVASSPEGQRAEAGIIGREGFVLPALALGADRVPYMVQMQIADDAHRIATADLLTAMDASATLRRALLLFAQVHSVQSSFTTLSNAVHNVEERLARWLLMCHDRSDSDNLALTHEFIGVMLTVRRPSVTTALHVLEGNGFINSVRGFVTIRNRVALEEFAGDAYGQAEAEYGRLLGPL